MPEDEQERAIQLPVNVPPEHQIGKYVNFASVRGGEHDITIDFCQIDAPALEARVVARIVVAPTFIGPLLKAIADGDFQREQIKRRIDNDGQTEQPEL